jgi:5-methylcytosine-specific restriction endonuclease McrA
VPYTDREIFIRDNWRCHLCGKKIDPQLPRRHPDGATIDHLVPLSDGGADAPSNVASAHMRCNKAKGVRAMNEQLRLL